MSDLYQLLQRLDDIAEGTVTPVGVKHGLNPQQKKVNQMPALFKTKDISPVLGAKKDPQHPAKDYFVGGESQDDTEGWGGMVGDDGADSTPDGVSPDTKMFLEKESDDHLVGEDVLSTVKKKLGDYLADLSKEITQDPDLKDKIPQTVDKISPAVKTITTDDGHEIKIHGNEDDGFRVSIRNRQGQTRFETLDEAVMACEMYCSRRRMAEADQDYMEER